MEVFGTMNYACAEEAQPTCAPTQGTHKVLVAEDDLSLSRGLELNLRREGYDVFRATNGPACLNDTLRHRPQVILLDLMLPGMNGFDVCRELRRRGVDAIVIILTARSQELDRVVGLEVGADDYIVKPFSLPELLARIRAHLRRYAFSDVAMKLYQFDGIEIDFVKFLITRNGEPVQLTTKEFELLRLLISCRGEVLTRDRILQLGWGYDASPTTRTVDNHILHLRQKLEPDPSRPRYIMSVYGEGYKFVA
jgi:DNA-binding response OmpR family regulator